MVNTQVSMLNFLEHAYDVFIQLDQDNPTLDLQEFLELLHEPLSCSIAVGYFAGVTKTNMQVIYTAIDAWDIASEFFVQMVINNKRFL